MKKVFLGLVVMMMALLLMAPMANAWVTAGDYIIPYIGAYGGANNGGPFDIYKGGEYQFETFCIEYNEHFTPGGTYYVQSISTGAIMGGVGGFDPISSQTAYLYNQWTTGAIEHNDANAAALQLAIWAWEGEWSSSLSGLAKTYYDQAFANANGSLYGVMVMNLYTGPGGGLAQDMLIQTPVPAAAWLLGSALLSLVAIRRRINC